MVDITVKEDGIAIWHGSEGRDFGLRIGWKRRLEITRFIIDNTNTLPVNVSLERLDKRRSPRIYCCHCNSGLKVGLTFNRFFIVIDLEDIHERLRNIIIDSQQ